MDFEPTQDWLILEPMVKRQGSVLLPEDATDPLSPERRREDLEAFKVVAVGPWVEEDEGSEHNPKIHDDSYVPQDVEVGDIVMIEGLGFAVFKDGDKRYAVSRARNIIYFVHEADELVGYNEGKEGGSGGTGSTLN